MPYKQAFVANQVARIGDAYNPFFHFYEGARDYPITHNGEIVNVKAVAWLRNVRDKIIHTTPETLAQIATEVAMHYVMLARELIMEDIRAAEFPDAPSRQRCLYACDTLDEARIGTNASTKTAQSAS
jgi:uncharacterized protein DUF2441